MSEGKNYQLGVGGHAWGWGLGQVQQQINKQMSQKFNVSFQKQTFGNHQFEKGSNLQESSVREESIKNGSFHMNAMEIRESAVQFLGSYQPIDPEFPIQILSQSANLAHKTYKESDYYGEVVNAKKQGLGIMVYKSGKLFEGRWENDKKEGSGLEQFANGCFYKGNYGNGKPEGEGCYTWSNGEVYEGQWRKGERHGSGEWIGANGDAYAGEWRFGKLEGYGVLTSSNEDVYEGQFKDSLKNGAGVQKFANGDMYRGQYANGMPSGEGVYYWRDESYFKGNFLNGLRQGKGLWKKGAGNCDKYEGSYKNDKKWGYGEFTWESGNCYKGNYEGDVRSGYGEMYWLNGSFYKGEWVNGVQHGEGEIFIPEYGYKKAIFSNNAIAEVLEERLIKKTKKSELDSSEGGERFKGTKSFRSKHQNLNRLKQMAVKDQLSKQATLESVEWTKPNSQNQKQETIFEGSEHRIRVQKQAQSRKSNEREPIQQKKPFFQRQISKPYQMQSLDVTKRQQNAKPDANRSKPKQRILHSSFYLYKLTNWQQKGRSTTCRNTPNYINNFLQN